MAQGSRDGIRHPVCNKVLRARGSDLDLVRELPYGPAALERPHPRPDRCQHPTYAPIVLKISLAPMGASTDVAIYWQGRARGGEGVSDSVRLPRVRAAR